MIIIETCPKCGADLQDSIICTNPPIPRKECLACGWHWEGEPDQEIVRVPFGGNSVNENIEHGSVTVTQLLNDNTGKSIENTVVHEPFDRTCIEGTLNVILDTATNTFRSPESNECMIEKLEPIIECDEYGTPMLERPPSTVMITKKINELIDVVNHLKSEIRSDGTRRKVR